MVGSRLKVIEWISYLRKDNSPGSALVYQSGEKILRIAIGLFLFTWLARYLGPEKFGQYSYVINFVIIFQAFSVFGLDERVSADLVEGAPSANIILGTSFCLKLLGALIGYGLMLLAHFLIDPENSAQLFLLCLYGLTLFIKSLDNIELFFQSKMKLRPVVVTRTFGFLSSGGFKIGAILQNAGVMPILIFHGLEVFFAKTFLLLYFFSTPSHWNWKFSAPYCKSLIKRCWPIFFIGLMATLEARLGMIFLDFFSFKSELGNYAIAWGLIEVLTFIPISLTISFFPKLVRESNKRDNSNPSARKKLYALLIWSSVLMAAVVWPFSEPLINLLYGEGFESAGQILKWYMLKNILMFFHLGRQKFLILNNQIKECFIINILYIAFNVLFQIFLTPTFYGLGAIWASLLAILITNLVLAPFFLAIRESFRDFFNACTLPFK